MSVGNFPNRKTVDTVASCWTSALLHHAFLRGLIETSAVFQRFFYCIGCTVTNSHSREKLAVFKNIQYCPRTSIPLIYIFHMISG